MSSKVASPLFTASQAASYLKLGTLKHPSAALRRLVRRGDLRAVKGCGRTIKYRQQDLDACIDKMQAKEEATE